MADQLAKFEHAMYTGIINQGTLFYCKVTDDFVYVCTKRVMFCPLCGKQIVPVSIGQELWMSADRLPPLKERP